MGRPCGRVSGGLDRRRRTEACCGRARQTEGAAADINTPRAEAKHVTFETTEGTWMSVDVSPDGATIVFDMLGDLYTVPIAGGAATALTKGPAFDYHPRYSPDGKTIAFTSDENGMENLWLIDADGKNRRALTAEKTAYVRSAAWLPGGEYLVARKEDGKRAGIPPTELWLYHRRGGNGIKLTSSDDLNSAAGPVASPDGRFIYFSAREARFSYQPKLAGGLWDIYRFDRTTGERSQITSGIGGAATGSVTRWQDARLCEPSRRRERARRAHARNGAERVLARNVERDDQEGFTAMDVWPNYAFLPDNSAIVYSSHGKLRAAAGRQLRNLSRFVPRTRSNSGSPTVTWQEHAASGPVGERSAARRAVAGRPLDRSRGVRAVLAAASRQRQASRRAATADDRRRARARIHAGVLS